MNKKCRTCGVIKGLDTFNKHKRNTDGRQSRCKSCDSKDYYLNKERHVATGKIYQNIHKDKISKNKKKRYIKDIQNGTNILGYLKKKYTGMSCLDCNELYSFHIMDFDHRAESIKLFCIGHKNSLKSTTERVAEVEKEIAKCDYICSNCHRERTYQRKH